MWKWAVIEAVKVWLLGRPSKKHERDEQHHCRGPGCSEGRDTENESKGC
jgi:hypothetical protein